MHLRHDSLSFACAAALAVLALLAAPQRADAIAIDVGTITLQPNTARQPVQVFVTGGEAVAGIDLFAEILPENMAVTLTPVFSDVDANSGIGGVDLLTGTIFSATASANQTDSIAEETRLYSIVDSTENSTADGLVATFYVDTTGVLDGRFEFNLVGVADGAGDTQFVDLSGATVPGTITNGFIEINTVVPEPAVLGTLGLAGFLGIRRRAR